MSEFNFNFEKPFELGIEVPIKNHKMLLNERHEVITELAGNYIVVANKPRTTHFLYENISLCLLNTFLLDIEISLLPLREQPKPYYNITFDKITKEDYRGIIFKKPGMGDSFTNKIYLANPDISNILNVEVNRDKIILKTIPYDWDNEVSTTQLLNTYGCAYAVVPANINVIEHAMASFLKNGAYAPDGLDEYAHRIRSDITDKHTFLVEFMNYRLSCWYKFRSTNVGDTIKAFVNCRDADDSDYYDVGYNDIRSKTWDMSPSNDVNWHFWSETFAISNLMEYWDNSTISSYVTTSNSGDDVIDTVNSPFISPAVDIGYRIYLNISGVSYYGTVYSITSSTNIKVSWDDSVTPPNSSGDVYKVYNKEFGINSEYVVNRAIIGFYNYNATGSGSDMRSAFAYPVLEFCPFTDIAGGFFAMDQTPDDFSFKEINYKKEIDNLNGTSKIFDSTNNYKSYEISADFSNYNAKFLQYLLDLQSWNREGWNIVLRPYCKLLPPVLIGDLYISKIKYNHYDNNLVDFTLEFIEN